jgi:hypothetical protein
MSQPLARLYDLALRALDDQERRASELRGRVGPVLAAGGVGTTLLARPAFGSHSHGVVETAAIAIAVLALFSTIGATGYLLRAQSMAGDFNVPASVEDLARAGALEHADAFYVRMIMSLHHRQLQNRRAIRRLQAVFTAILCGILVELGSFAVAAPVG